MEKVFQTSFYDHILRDDADLRDAREYIAHDPARWQEDELYNEE